MGNWREFQEMNRDAMNEAAFRRAENAYLTPPEPPEDDIEIEEDTEGGYPADYFEEDPEDVYEEMQLKKYEREKEEK